MLFEHTQNWRLYFILRIYVALHCEVLCGEVRLLYARRQRFCSIANQTVKTCIASPSVALMSCMPKCCFDFRGDWTLRHCQAYQYFR
jgi:hypothetical protein